MYSRNAEHFVFKYGRQTGPFTFPKIQSMRQAGTIDVTDQIRRSDSKDWQPVGELSQPAGWGHSLLRFKVVAASVFAFIATMFAWLMTMIWWM
jgi:hypothetical protein